MSIRLISCKNPFTTEREERDLPDGLSIGELLTEAEIEPMEGTVVCVQADCEIVKLEDFYTTFPKEGALVTVRVVPQEPTTITAILLAAAAFAAKAGFVKVAALLLVAAVTVALVTAPETEGSGGRGAESPNTSPALTGTRNTLRKFSVVPRIFGKYRVTPMLGAKPFTETIGDEQFLRMLFVPGYGPADLTSMRIGDTALSDFVGVETEIRQGFPGEPPLTLFTQEVDTVQVGINLPIPSAENNEPTPGVPITRTTEGLADEISLDFFFAQGFRTVDSHGGFWSLGIDIQIEARSGTEAFQLVTLELTGQLDFAETPSLGVVRWSGNVVDQLRRGVRFKTANLQGKAVYDVRVTRLKHWIVGPSIVITQKVGTRLGDGEWTVLRSHTALDPIKIDGMAKIALRIRASDQLKNVIENFNVLVETMHPIYDPTNPAADAAGFLFPEKTRNPAWHALDILRGIANQDAVADSRIKLAAFENWAANNEANGRNFDAVLDFHSTVLKAFNQVASVGRASLLLDDGDYSVVQDVLKTTIVQHFTPRNSFGFKGKKEFIDQPDALRISFPNEENNYETDELIVYADGFTEETAKIFLAVDFFGITNAEKVWEEGRFHQAIALNRNQEFELTTDFEYLVAKRGDLVLVSHDVAPIGLAYGRIKSLSKDGGSNILDVTLDEEMTFESGKSYAMRIRSIDGSGNTVSTIANVDNPAAGGPNVTTTFVTFTVTIPAADGTAVGDLCIFGIASAETEEFLVLKIDPQPDLKAVITMIPHVPSVYSADAGPIPFHEIPVTLGPDARPAKPTITEVISRDGKLIVALEPTPGSVVETATYSPQFRLSGQANYTALAAVSAQSPTLEISPVSDGDRYDIRIFAVSATGIQSDPAVVLNILFTDERIFLFDFSISGLQIVGQGNVTEFEGRDVSWVWRLNAPKLSKDPLAGIPEGFFDTVTHPSFQSFEVRISDATTGAVLRTRQVEAQNFTYSFQDNKRDGGPRRAITIDVAFKDLTGTIGERKSLTANNPAPLKHLLVPKDDFTGYFVFTSFGSVWVSFVRPRDGDYVGTLMFLTGEIADGGKGPGFIPTQADVVKDGVGPPMIVDAPDGKQVFVKIASYDEFAVDPVSGKVTIGDLNISDEVAITVLDIGDIDLANLTVSTFADSDLLTHRRIWGTYRTQVEGQPDGPVNISSNLQDEWIELDNIDVIAAAGSRVAIFSFFWVMVGSIFKDMAHLLNPGSIIDVEPETETLFGVPKVIYRIVRYLATQGSGTIIINGVPGPPVPDDPTPGIVVFTSDQVSMSVRGFFLGGSISKIDSPAPNVYNYSLQIKWIPNHYTFGQAKTDIIGQPNGRRIIGTGGTRWYELWKAFDDVTGTDSPTSRFRFRWADQGSGDLKVIRGGIPGPFNPSDTADDMIVFDSFNPETRTTFQDYVIDMDSNKLTLDINRSFLQAAEFRK